MKEKGDYEDISDYDEDDEDVEESRDELEEGRTPEDDTE